MMIYANKKVALRTNSAQQTAQIIANVIQLEEKHVLRLEENTVYLYPKIWKDKLTALNWLSCLHHYYCIKKRFKSMDSLYFKHIETGELLGSVINKKPKLTIEVFFDTL